MDVWAGSALKLQKCAHGQADMIELMEYLLSRLFCAGDGVVLSSGVDNLESTKQVAAWGKVSRSKHVMQESCGVPGGISEFSRKFAC